MSPREFIHEDIGMYTRADFFVAVALSLGLSVPCLADDKPSKEEIVVLHDLPYREGASHSWRLDLAMPRISWGSLGRASW